LTLEMETEFLNFFNYTSQKTPHLKLEQLDGIFL